MSPIPTLPSGWIVILAGGASEPAAEVEKIPNYRPGIHPGKSAEVSHAIVKYCNDYTVSPRGIKKYKEIIGFLNGRIDELEARLASPPTLKASIMGLLHLPGNLLRKLRGR